MRHYQVVESQQGTFVFDPDDQFVGKSLSEIGSYGVSELRLLDGFTNKNSRILWIGAHIGALLIPVSKKVKMITGIEANPYTFKKPQMNVKINDCNNVQLFNVAAGESFSTIEFVLNTHNSGGSKRKPQVARDIYYYDRPEICEVPLKRMDDFLESNEYDVLFMDIEGSEYYALQGMPKTLKNIKVMFMEFLPFLIKDVANINAKEFSPFVEKFSILIAPKLGKFCLKENIMPTLIWMFENNHCEDGLIFLTDEPNVEIIERISSLGLTRL
jgi:FkbM family methyltransferase